jgi:hypothetical protein
MGFACGGRYKFLCGAVRNGAGFENLIGLQAWPLTYFLIHTPVSQSAFPSVCYYSFSKRQNERDKRIEKIWKDEEGYG